MDIVIADAGPLIALAKITHLHILKDLFSGILITQAVVNECLQAQTAEVVITELNQTSYRISSLVVSQLKNSMI